MATGTGLPAPTVVELIDERPLSAFQIRTIILCGLVLVLDGFNGQTAGTLGAAISENMHIPLKTMGYVFSASLFGLMLASLAAGPIADRWGRKWMVVLSTVTFSIFSLLTARATSYNELVAFRFLTGLGLGAALPTVVSIATEYSPKRLAHKVVAMLFTGMPLGNFACGLTSSLILHRWGWRPVFYVGGLVPLALSLLLLIELPESIRFLAVRGGDQKKLARIMVRIVPERGSTVAFSTPAHSEPEGSSVKRLFTEGRVFATILFWIPFFMNLLLLYFVISWLPALLRQSGASLATGVKAATLFSLGGIIGSLSEGLLIDALGGFSLLLIEFTLCAALIGSLSFIATSALSLVFTVAFALGFCVTGAQGGLNALAASYYPTSMRSTGIGWALGVGRVGSIVGPILTGALLALRWTPQQIFLAGGLPALCGALAVAVSYFLSADRNAYRRQSSAAPSNP